jgi:cytochrome c peroxidase
MAHEWRLDDTPFDAVLRREGAFRGQAAEGMALFYGPAGCSTCHSGPFLTDHRFHAMGAPQIGPGKSATFEDHHRDEGRFRVTGRAEDLYAFRTPSLRNVALTAPYGHAGSHRDLATFVADHADPVKGLAGYDRGQAVLPEYPAKDFVVMDDPTQIAAIAAAVRTPGVPLTESDVAAIVAFLRTITETSEIENRLGIPDTVPSGLPVP